MSFGVVIADDEPLARDALRLALDDHADFHVVAQAADGHEAVEAIRGHEPDLVLLDIRMPGLDGFGVVRAIGAARMPAVVFVTAFDEFAVRAFEVHALDYIVKPFDDRRVGEMLDHVRRRLLEGRLVRLEDRLDGLLATLAGRSGEGRAAGPEGSPHVSRLMVREGDRVRFVEVAAVDYFEADGNHVVLHMGRERHRIRTSLRALEERLDPARFVRIHRSTILNLDVLAEVRPWFSGDHLALLRDGRRLKVSRHYRPNLLRESF